MGATIRQRNFARLAAQGVPLVDAKEQVYGKGNGKRKTRREEASKLAAKPEVRAAIASYEAQLMPIGDLRECKQLMLANIRDLALNSPDPKVRLAASVNLRDYIEAREALELDHRTVTIDALVREIGAMQAPAAEPELELEDVPAEQADAATEPAAAAEPETGAVAAEPAGEPEAEE
jgi:hypothetical protein